MGRAALVTGAAEIDEQAVRRAASTGHTWRNPIWRHSDGSLAEW